MMYSHKLLYRFKKDFNLALPILGDKEIFMQYIIRLNYSGPWQKFINAVSACGSEDKFLEKYSECKEALIQYITNTKEYKEFNTGSMEKWVTPGVFSSSNIWNPENCNKKFLSIDLKSANFQTLHLAGIIKEKTWQELVSKVIPHKELVTYLSESKYIRQVVFGQCNPKRNITLEKYYIYQVKELLKDYIEQSPVIMNNDELVYQVSSDIDCANLKDIIYEKLGVTVSIKLFSFTSVSLVNTSHDNLRICEGFLVKENYEYYLKCVPEPYRLMFQPCLDNPEVFLSSVTIPVNGKFEKYIEHEKIICEIKDNLVLTTVY